MWTYQPTPPSELYHFGILGMKWGVRRYQNKNGTLTPAGKKQKEDAVDELKKNKEEYIKSAEIGITQAKKAIDDILSGKKERYVTDEEHTLDPKNPTMDLVKFFKESIAARRVNLPIITKYYDDKISDVESGRINVGKDTLRLPYRVEGEVDVLDPIDYGLFNPDDDLQHFGVIGMKWGVRRYQNKDGTLTPAGKKQYEESLRTKVKDLPDDDIRKMINRLQMEKQLVQLMSEQETKPESKGQSLAKEYLKQSGKLLVGKLASGFGEYLSKKMFDGAKTNLDIKNERRKNDAAKRDKERQEKKDREKRDREEMEKRGEEKWKVPKK